MGGQEKRWRAAGLLGGLAVLGAVPWLLWSVHATGNPLYPFLPSLWGGGGWTDYERDKLQKRGFELFRMGSRILRTDTACVGLLSMISEFMATEQHG